MFNWREPFKSRLYLYKYRSKQITILNRAVLFLLSAFLILIVDHLLGYPNHNPQIGILYSAVVGLITATLYPVLRHVIPNIMTINEKGIFYHTGSLTHGRYYFDQLSDFSIERQVDGKVFLELHLKDKRTTWFAIASDLPMDKLSDFLSEKVHGSEKVENAPTVKTDRETSRAPISRHMSAAPVEAAISKQYDLAQNKFCKFFLLFSAVAFFYAIIDLFYNMEYYAGGRPYSIFILSTIYTFVFAIFVLKLSKVPTPEAFVVSVLLGLATGFAAYPGLLRFNQITDKKGLIEYTYYPSELGTLYPKHKNLPVLQFRYVHGYWAQFDHDSPYPIPVRLRKGALNFYQVDFKPIYKDIKNWNRKKGRQSKKSIGAT